MRRSFGFLLLAFAVLLTPRANAQTESVVYNFCNFGSCTDGAAPNQGIIQASDGNYYGTTSTGGANGSGSIFRLTPSGTLTTLYSLCGSAGCSDGKTPSSQLVQAPDGSLFGTTLAGGTSEEGSSECDNGCGVMYRITLAGSYSVIYNFCQKVACGDGQQPGQFILGSDGNFYGVASEGGPPYTPCQFGCGEIYKMTPAGVWSAVYGFQGQNDGLMPTGLVQGTDGNFYGTSGGGANSEGTIFQIIAGTFQTIYTFCATTGCADGSEPTALVQGSDGNYYGGTFEGGTNGKGTLFKVTSAGVLNPLYSFCSTSGCGNSVSSPMYVASNGNFYGTTASGGTTGTNCTTGCGELFELTSSGSYAGLHAFAPATADAQLPSGPLAQASNGSLYGTSSEGGTTADCQAPGCGTVYSYAPATALAAPVQVSLSASQINLGSPVTLTWKSLNAFSDTMRQCYAYQTVGGALTALGLQAGTYNSTTKVYSGSASITPGAAGTYSYAITCGGQESGQAALTVTATTYATTTAVTYSPNPASVGQTVTLKAAVTHASGSAVLTGKVTFSVGGTAIGSGTVNTSGVASLTAGTNGLAAGSYPVVATYSGDANYKSSASPATTVTLNKAATTTTVTASPNPVTPPAACTLTATVKRSASGAAGYATGSVTFSVSTTVIGTVGVNAAGVAKLTAPTKGIAAGGYPVVATYNGDSSDVTSHSTAVTVTVQ
jgi:uncharacterized repeat protein (TIGR03803 family)